MWSRFRWIERPDSDGNGCVIDTADGFDDPGNLQLDIVVNVLRLWKFVVGFKVNQVRRIFAGEYGTRGNKSSKGPVNLRGNIIEAATVQLQKLSKRPDDRDKYGATSSGSGYSGLPFGCDILCTSDVFLCLLFANTLSSM